MKIAVLHPQFFNGGLDRVVVRLTKGFVERGHDVDLLTVSKSGRVYGELDPGVKVIHLRGAFRLPAVPRVMSTDSWVSLLSIPALALYLRRRRPAVLLAASALNAAVMANGLSRTGTKTVLRVSLHQSASTEHDRHVSARLVPSLRRRVFKRADAIVTNSEVNTSNLIDEFDLSHEKAVTINNPSADPGIIEKAKMDVDHPWLSQHDEPVAVAVGRLAPVKDVGTMLRAFALVRQQAPCRLLVLGDGVERQRLEALADELQVRDSVDFIGFVDNPWAYMARADLFVTSSVVEGSPNSLIEVVFLGVPAVATDCPSGPSEILNGGEFGRLVEVGDHEAFATAWLEVLSDPEKAKATAASAQDHISKYRFDTVVDQYIELFSSL